MFLEGEEFWAGFFSEVSYNCKGLEAGGGEKEGGVQRGAGEQKKDAGGAIASDGKLELANQLMRKASAQSHWYHTTLLCVCALDSKVTLLTLLVE